MALDRKIINDFENKRKNKNYIQVKNFYGMNFSPRFNIAFFICIYKLGFRGILNSRLT